MNDQIKRVRPKVSKFREAAQKIKEDAAVQAAAEEETFDEEVAQDDVGLRRTEMRPPMREEDPRTRAARRAEEIRNHTGGLDDGTDDFYIDPRDIPPGWSYEWKRKTVLGQEDPAYMVSLARKGWEPVPASRHPHMMPEGWTATATIERKGLILMERPLELTEEQREIDRRAAINQVRQKEQQLAAAPAGTFDRNNKDSSLVKVKKSYESIPIPKD
jgi:hypothetical protein